jgi:hypothetical protein
MQVAPASREHTDQDLFRDKNLLIEELHQNSNVFEHQPGRKHNSFDEPRDIFARTNVRDLHKWIRNKKREYAGEKWAF